MDVRASRGADVGSDHYFGFSQSKKNDHWTTFKEIIIDCAEKTRKKPRLLPIV